MKKHVVITSLQEDMRNIFGRPLTEMDDMGGEEPAPDPEEEGGNPMEPDEDPPMGEMDEPEDEEPVDESDDDDEDDMPAEEAKHQIASLANGFLSAHTRGPAVESRQRGGKRAKPKTKKKPFVKPLTESRAQRIHRLAEGNIFSTAPAPRGNRRSSSRIQSLLEEVGGIVGDIHRSRKEEQIKGFANIAVIAGMLEGRFRSIGMDLSEGGIYKVAGVMKRLSEQASDVAVGLDSPDEEPEAPAAEMDDMPGDEEPADEAGEDPAVDEMFKKLMAKLLDALQLYNDVTGKEEMDPVPGEGDDEEPDMDDGEEDVVRVGEMDDPPAPPPPAASDDDEEDDDEEEEPVAEGEDPSVGGSGGAPPEGPYGQPDEEGDNAMSEALRLVRAMRRTG
jgi:hypothetical protein